VTINQCPTVLFWEEIFNYNLIKVLDIVGLGCVHARCSCGLELCLDWMTGIFLPKSDTMFCLRNRMCGERIVRSNSTDGLVADMSSQTGEYGFHIWRSIWKS